jgi:hypothetical protein
MVMFGALVLVGIAVFMILQPIIAGREAPLWGTGSEPSEAQFRKRVSLLQLRDAEYEFAMGKLGQEDYNALRRELSAEALAAIRAEEHEDAAPSGSFDGLTNADLEEEIAAVRARLAGGPFCSECGRPNSAGSRFCADCGTPLQPSEAPGNG